MTDHPITPPPELLKALSHQFHNGESLEATWARAFKAGADQELEACCTELDEINCQKYWSQRLRAARRPKPPSLKAQALDELHISFDRGYLKEGAADTIRRALEALPDD
jgi:hypothetical protein